MRLLIDRGVKKSIHILSKTVINNNPDVKCRFPYNNLCHFSSEKMYGGNFISNTKSLEG